MKTLTRCCIWAATIVSFVSAQDANITLVPAAIGFEGDNTGFVYGATPRLVVNDGSAADGGFRAFSFSNGTTLAETSHKRTGRSKIAVPVYGIGGRDLIVNIPAPDSLIRIFDAATGEKVVSNDKKQLGDWSTACVWRSQKSGESYIFLFGKKMVVQFLIRGKEEGVEILEVQTFPVAIEGESCSVVSDDRIFFSAEDQPLYSFQALETTHAPEIQVVSEKVEVAGLATYRSTSSDYLLVAHDEVIDVYDSSIQMEGTIALSGIADLSIEGGLSILQSPSTGYPSGVIVFAFEGADDTGVAIGSLEDALAPLGVELNNQYTPPTESCESCGSTITEQCSYNGFNDGTKCSCFTGFTGSDCSNTTCSNDCSDQGECVGPNVCQCHDGWTGPNCSFIAVKPKYETEANGGDGDDPAIWIHPTRPDQSRIITTTKSEQGEGFGVFDLQGKLLQQLRAEEPNNVDIIYNFTVGNRTVDLAYAACRGDNTLCLVQINSTGVLSEISGGVQSLPEDYEPYGSCNYRSQISGKEYLFVNNKEAQYLQYELTATANGTLQTTLVREFQGGSGGQVEGCVADEGAGYVFIGEEPSGIWRYEAEPDGSDTGVQFAQVGDESGLHADVEGLTLVPARSGPNGYIMVSSQGISAYFIYERAPPHEYIGTFTIVNNEEKGIDHVSNTDGITAVSNALNNDFPSGLIVTHDDANELSGSISLPATQHDSAASSSYWFSHLLTTTENKQYSLIANYIVLPNNLMSVRTSLLDVNNTETYWQTAKVVSLEGNSILDNGQLSIKGAEFELSSSAKDNIGTMVSAGSTDDFGYHLTVQATSRVILNAGTGIFKWGANDTTQWSLPSCQTSGTLSIGNSSYTIDGEQSLSWYDRQYGDSLPDRGFTWFGVQFPGSDVRASIWFWDSKDPEQHISFGTVRTDFGLKLVRHTVTVYEDEAWTSPRSNATYQTKWLLEFDNGDYLHIQNVRKDQEIYSENTLVASAFATVEGKFCGQESGFAIVDFMPSTV
ncbi:hypothetical protein TW65_01025 [Stemphylium lycopersici]|uniref:Thermostable phytase n=1 Tax=Stemphylium lycopersici TaxID=183478 RepID=A0A364MWS7_STELY|nr:hypothetical protein TW65_01025 [Stemphylium lycopersici]RAR05755.1 thermostable phytase [Stemphylium lycopersici]